jgi:hypothetical protein
MPDERRIAQASRLAEDLPALWRSARPERRKELVATLLESIRVAGGNVVAVRPRPELAPLFALKVLSTRHLRSRPESNPPVFVSGIAVEGLEELLILTGAIGA